MYSTATLGERHEVGFVRVVMDILHSRGDDARRRRRHEHFRKRGGLRMRADLQAPDLVFNALVSV